MEKVFGLPATELAISMAIILAAIFILLVIGATRRFILVKMGTRNIPRRKGQSSLIVIGLMLSSAIIATSLGIGDTVRYSVRSVALDFLGPTDEIIDGPGMQLFGDEYFNYSEFQNLEQSTVNNPSIDGLIPLIEISLPSSNDELGLAESDMKVRGLDSKYSDSFGELVNIKGEIVSISQLGKEEVYINEKGSEKLKTLSGDKVSIYTKDATSSFTVLNVLKNGGLSGGPRDPYIVMNLDTLQSLTGKNGQITNIFVSNIGSGEKSISFSDEVTRFLKSELTDPQSASQLFNLLNSNNIPTLLSAEALALDKSDKETADVIRDLAEDLKFEAYNDGFIENISDYQTQLVILGILEKSQLNQEAAQFSALSSSLTILRVDDRKNSSVKLAETIATGVTTIFSIFGSFSIMVGMLLIFLVFVLLAAARSTELGMARAVGLKRRDLVQLFTYEGTIYAFLASIIGTAIGVGLSFGLVYILQDLIDSDDFAITPYYSLVSLVIAFSSGMILTFVTVVFSAYRASNLNIVVAIRGLRDEFVKKAPDSFKKKLIDLAWNLIFPIKQLIFIILGRGPRLNNLLLLMVSPIAWPINILISLFKLSGKNSYLLLGIFSLLLMFSGLSTGTGASFFLGLTGTGLSVGLFIRFLSSKFTSDQETINQFGGSFEGGLVLLANSLPPDFFEGLVGELSQPGPWFWPIGGAISTGAAVWFLMSNTRILIALLNLILSRFSGLKAVTKTAISYPMASKFRTGLTVAMFALIIFTLMIFSILNGIGDITTEQPERVTGGFDIKATVSRELPITGNIEESLVMSNFSVVAGASTLPVEVREISGENKSFKQSQLVSLDDSFFESTEWRMAHFDPKFGTSDKEIWKSLLENPDLVVANATIIPSGDPFGPPDRSFKTSYIESGDSIEMESFTISMRKMRGDSEDRDLTVIGVIERLASGTGFGAAGATFYSANSLASIIAGENVSYDTFYFKLNNKDLAVDYSQKLENTFLANGMRAESLLNQLEEERATNNAFNKLFQGFSGLGLVVGVAAIGVLSVRAVVERRQSIGVLRAIGFRSSMIRTQFLIESSFITLLGIVVGIFLGTLQSWLIFREISKELEGAKFSVPIGEVGILILITIAASILASVIPANEASKTYPAEALRYE